MSTEITSTGGAATNRGIWYQALWVVLQAAESKIANFSETTDQAADEEVVRVVLEPDGGDVRVEFTRRKRVVQLKVKSQGTWSLKDLITEVLPDLYRAVDINEDRATYEFVTEGKQGQWEAALTFFNGLGGRLKGRSVEVAHAELSTETKIPFNHSVGEFWKAVDDTERGLFDRIVEVLRGPPPPAGKQDRRESLDVVREKTWHLLARLRFSGGHSPQSVRAEVERALLNVVPHREQLAQLCNAMGGWICDRSSTNNNAFTPRELFAAHNLEHVVPVGNLIVIRRRFRDELRFRLHRLRYIAAWDVRRSPSGATDMPSTAITVLTGGSGEGKSWRLYAAADEAQTPAVVLQDSCGDFDKDLERAAGQVWQEVLGHDAPKPLGNIGAHLREALGSAYEAPWLTICLDRVASVETANQILLAPLEKWGCQVVVACESHVASVFDQEAETNISRIIIKKVGPFSSGERDKYLNVRLGEGYARVPSDIRDLLRSPLLAGIYCDLVTESPSDEPSTTDIAWLPHNEYELVDKFWERLDGPETPSHSTLALRLRKLVGGLLSRNVYPWSIDQLDDARVDSSDIEALIHLGWLRPTSNRGKFEIPHDRLLGYAVAKELVARTENGLITAEVVEALQEAQDGNYNARLRYTLMDWFHLATSDETLLPLAKEVLRLHCDKADWYYREQFYRRLLPTLGKEAIQLLVEHLREVAPTVSIDMGVLSSITEGLSASLRSTDADTRSKIVLSCLNDKHPKINRAGLRLMRNHSVKEGLDKAWHLHIEMQANPRKFAEYDGAASMLYRESFAALKAGAREEPGWLDQAIQKADPSVDPVADLAYLAANLDDDGELWLRRKADLINKVPTEKVRSLAANIGVWHDIDELPRLEEWAMRNPDTDDDWVIPAAIKAMSRIDPKEAAKHLASLPAETRYFHRNNLIPRLMITAPEETFTNLLNCISQSEYPLSEARALQGDSSFIDATILDALLDALNQWLEKALEWGDDKQRGPMLVEFSTIAEAARLDLLAVFANRSGSPLEANLKKYLIEILSPQTGHRFEREEALTVLLRINGDAFCEALRTFLESEDFHTKLEVLEWAKWYSDSDLLASIGDAAAGAYSAHQITLLLQQEATYLLVGYGDFRNLMNNLGDIMGIRLPYNLPDWLPFGSLSSCDDLLEELAGRIRDSEGNLLQCSLGISGLLRAPHLVDEALQILESATDEPTQIASISALGFAGTQDERVVTAISGYLQHEKLRFVSLQALWRIGGEHAEAALKDSLKHRWDDPVAIQLGSTEKYTDKIVESLVERIASEVGGVDLKAPFYGSLYSILAMAPDDLLSEVIRKCPNNVHDHLREEALKDEGSFWIVGSKSRAIRGLAVIDSEAAVVAASMALENRDAHDRSLYPPILYRYGASKALEIFLRLAGEEPDDSVVASMSYTLSATEDSDWLSRSLRTKDDETRISACRLATGPCGYRTEIQEILRGLIDDPSARVADSAVDALRHIHRQQQAEELVGSLSTSDSRMRVAVVVQAAVTVGDAGYKSGPYPGWVNELFKAETIRQYPTIWHAASKQIEESREKAKNKAASSVKNRLRD